MTGHSAATFRAEQAKWDEYYASLPHVEPDDTTADFNSSLSSLISDLLEPGSRILEAGCGGGWQSLEIAKSGRFDVTLLDFSRAALDYAAEVFRRENVPGRFLEGDFSQPGDPDYDLVFNAGVLEHYTLDEQVGLLRGMASRSQRFVLVLVPNARCYWYWLWRARMVAAGKWKWGKESPAADLTEVFAFSGIPLLGHCYLGERWTEHFILETLGAESEAAREMLAIHRSPAVPHDQKCYLTAALGAVNHTRWSPRPPWRDPALRHSVTHSELHSALVDSVALRAAARRESADAAAAERSSWEAERRAWQGERAAWEEERRAWDGQRHAWDGEREHWDAAHNYTRALLSASYQEHEKLRTLAEDAQSQAQEAIVRAEYSETSAASARRALEERAGELAKTQESLAGHQAASAAARRQWERESADARQRIEITQKARQEAERAHAAVSKELDESRAAASRADQALTSAVQYSESLRRGTVTSFARYSAELDGHLRTYQGQRAWRAMLAFREAYTLVARGGIGGKLRALALPFKWMFGDPARLDAYEPPFPDAWQFAPREIDQPVRREDFLSPAPGPATGYDVIVLPIFDFEFRFQRPQQIAAGMAKLGHRVFWVSPSRTCAAGEKLETVQLRDNMWEVRLPETAVNLYGGGLSEVSASHMADAIEVLCREFAVSESCAYLQFPYWRKLGLALRRRIGSRVVYDMMDDWQNWPTEPLIGEENLADELELVRETDVLVVTAGEFAERHAANRPAPLLVPNGADFEFFHAAEPAGKLADIKHPIIGYYGAISSWFDVELVAETARLRPDFSFVLIGQVHAIDPAPLAALPNVHLLGEKSYREIPAYLREFDVCLIPFRINELTRAVDPVKLYEYLSQGKPVVATPMTELEPHRGIIRLASTASEFASAIDAALLERAGELAEKRVEFASKNTWSARVEAIRGAIASSTPLVSVLVVTHDSAKFLPGFIDAFRRNTTYPNWELIFVDNNSGDSTPALLDRLCAGDPRMHVHKVDKNLGFAAGNNLAAWKSRGEYLVLLNADTLVSRGWLGRLMEPLRRDSGVGVTAPVTNFSGNETKIDFRYSGVDEMEDFAGELARKRQGITMDLPVVPLLCAALSRKTWDAVGGLDERFEVGMFEDDDFCKRVAEANLRIVTAEDCFIHHFGNGSFEQLDPDRSRRIFAENRKKFEEKWDVEWKEHSMRPGVRPLNAEPRFKPEEFSQRDPSRSQRNSVAPLIRRLLPNRTNAGVMINPQPDGNGALAVECDLATPATQVKFGDSILPTTYGSATLLTAVLTPDLVKYPGPATVRLVSDAGMSPPVDFFVD
ncbi:MAG: glycosyltransferase [Bryobacteraceae bacterium]